MTSDRGISPIQRRVSSHLNSCADGDEWFPLPKHDTTDGVCLDTAGGRQQSATSPLAQKETDGSGQWLELCTGEGGRDGECRDSTTSCAGQLLVIWTVQVGCVHTCTRIVAEAQAFKNKTCGVSGGVCARGRFIVEGGMELGAGSWHLSTALAFCPSDVGSNESGLTLEKHRRGCIVQSEFVSSNTPVRTTKHQRGATHLHCCHRRRAAE